MSLYQTVKSAITVRQVGEMYGMEPDRHGMVCCPFHSDSDPSMKLNDTYYYCFGCGANGDAIDLTAKLFDLNPRQAAEKLIHDIGLDPDKPPANAIALPPPKRGLTDEQWADIAYCLRVLTDYLDLLHDWRERYKPASPEEPLDERFVEALHMTETIEHLTDCVAFGTPQQKADAAARLLSGSYLLMLEERTDQPGRTAGRAVRGSPPHDRDHRAPDGLRCIWDASAEGRCRCTAAVRVVPADAGGAHRPPCSGEVCLTIYSPEVAGLTVRPTTSLF